MKSRFLIWSGLLVVLCTAVQAGVEDFVLTEFVWKTYPLETTIPVWVLSDMNVSTGAFYAGCTTNAASDEAGNVTIKHSLTPSFKAYVFCGSNPGNKSRLEILLNHKVNAQASVQLSHEDEPGGASGTAKARLHPIDDSLVQYTAETSRNTIGTSTDTLENLVDGWVVRPTIKWTFTNKYWQLVGGQYRTSIVLEGDRSVADGTAISNAPDGALVQSVASAKGHFTYNDHHITIYQTDPSPQANLTLGDFDGDRELEVSLTCWNSSSTEHLSSGRAMIKQDGKLYAGFDIANGTYDIYVSVKGFLRKKFDNVSITDELFYGLSATLKNGDINGDNAIDVADYALISSNYNLTDSDTTWTRMDENFITPQDSDVNGDGAVDIGDYAIVSANYNEEGD